MAAAIGQGKDKTHLQQIVSMEGQIQTIYLAVYPNKLLLLDGACRSDVPKILSYITDTLERPLSQLKVVMVTHMHPDHAGGACLLKKKTGCQIVSANKQDAWYKGIKGRLSFLNDIALTHYVAYRQGKAFTNLLYNPVLKPDIQVSDGDHVPYFKDWIVIETSGHTDRDLSLWHTASRQVYTADLILKIKNKFVSPYLVTLPDQYKASILKVKNLRPMIVLLAHGGPNTITAVQFDEAASTAPNEPRRMTFLESTQLPQKLTVIKQNVLNSIGVVGDQLKLKKHKFRVRKARTP